MKVVAIGDSLTFGFPYTPESSWVRSVQELLGVLFCPSSTVANTPASIRRERSDAKLGISAAKVQMELKLHLNQVLLYNKGVNGDTTGQMLKRFGRDCLAVNPSHVIITGGTNDAFARKDPDEVLENIAAMIEQALKNGIKPIIGLPPPLNPPADEKILALYRAEMEAFAAEKGIAAINFYKAFLNSGGRIRAELFADGSHPNLEGYKIMAAAVFSCLKELPGLNK